MGSAVVAQGAAPVFPGAGKMERLRALRQLDRWLIRLPIIAATFIAKLGFPGLAAKSVSFALPMIYTSIAIGLVTGRLVIAHRRLVLFLLMSATLWLIQILRELTFSPLSLLMLCALHLPYVLHMASGDERSVRAWEFFRGVACVIAAIGILQYFGQFVVGPAIAFPFEHFLPEPLKVAGFNMLAYVQYGVAVYRSNGVFMLEPSFFSQLLAVAIVGELVYPNLRWWRLALYGVAVLVSYSGTGLIALAICLPLWVLTRARWESIGIGIAAAVAVAVVLALLMASGVMADNPFVKSFSSRVGEFTSTGSSGFARFVGGYFLFEQFLWPDPLSALFGMGSGSFVNYANMASYPAHGMALFKMVFEFGIVGAAVYFLFVVYCFADSRAPLLLRIAIFVPLMIQNYVPFAHGLAYSLLIWNLPRHAQRRAS